MADPDGAPKTVTLSMLCSSLGVSARKVQYLRETGIVIPAVTVVGRGRSCGYALDDAVRVYLALVVFPCLSYSVAKKALEEPLDADTLTVPLSKYAKLMVDLQSVKAFVEDVLG